MACVKISAAEITVIKLGDIPVGATVSVHTQDRAEHAVLIPAYEKLPEIGIVPVVCHKAADVGGPPGNTRKTHVLTCNDLILKGLKVGLNIACPNKCPVLLASYPCGTAEVDCLMVALGFLSVIECLNILLGIFAANL